MIDRDYITHIQEVLYGEFKRIGMEIKNLNVKMEHHPIHIGGRYQPVAHKMNSTIMSVNFDCNEEQFKYLRPFIDSYNARQTLIYPDVSWSTRAELPIQIHAESETIFDSTMILHLTGGSMKTWIESFREATEKLFYKIESREFDEEVIKTLSEE